MPWLIAAAIAAASPVPLGAQPAPGRARIKLDPERVIAEVHPHVFGNFVEHLGRCVYGGVFEEGSPLADENGFRKDVMDATRGLGVTLLRWPGGNFASGYNWKDGVGPRDQRPARRDHAWGALDSNRYGTDEFLTYCEKLQVDPYICINAGLGSVEDARNWVEYTNETANTYWAQQRRKNGRDKPWNVKIWGLGNEIDGPWQLGHKNAEDYAKFALEAAKAMRRSDESIKLIASGSSNFGQGSDWVGWNRTVLERLRNEIDYISLHTYVGNRTNDFEQFMAFGRDVDDRIEVVKGQIRAVRVGNAAARPIHIAFDEWNVWYRTITPGWTEYEIAKTGLEENYNYEDALAMAVFLNSFIRNADVVKMANLAQLVNVIAPMFTNPQGLYFQTIYFPIAEYAKQRGLKALDVLVESPAVQARQGPRARLPGRVRHVRPEDEADLRERPEPQLEERHRGPHRQRRRSPVRPGRCVGAQSPRPQGRAHVRQGPGGPAADAQRKRQGERQRLRLHVPQALAHDPEMVGAGS